MSSKIILKNGPGIPKKAGQTILAPGEPGWSTDLERLYVGTSDPQIPAMVGKPDDHVNVKHYGAKGDGVTDDTAAVKAAVSAARVHQLPIYFPKGAYKINGSPGDVDYEMVTFYGDGMNESKITNGYAPFNVTGKVRKVSISNLSLDCSKGNLFYMKTGAARNVDYTELIGCKVTADRYNYNAPLPLIQKLHYEQLCISSQTGDFSTSKRFVSFMSEYTRDIAIGKNAAFIQTVHTCDTVASTTSSGRKLILDGCRIKTKNNSKYYLVGAILGQGDATNTSTLSIRDTSFEVGTGATGLHCVIGNKQSTGSTMSLDVSGLTVTGAIPAFVIDVNALTNANVRTTFPRSKTSLFRTPKSPHSIWEQHSDGVWYNNVKVA